MERKDRDMDAIKGLFKSRKFMAAVIGVICALAVSKGWVKTVNPEMQVKIVDFILMVTGLYIGATAAEDMAAKAGAGLVKKPDAPKPPAPPAV